LYRIENGFIKNKTTGFNMKKILITFIWLTFSNSTFALDWFLDSDQARCNITYLKIDLNKDTEKIKYTTTQFDLPFNPDGGWIIADPCYKGSKKLAHKMNKWMGKSTNNFISDFTSPDCKRKTEDFFTSSWSKYKTCEPLYRQRMVDDWLKYPNQWDNDSNIDKIGIIKKNNKNYVHIMNNDFL
jgi:hypothetical protein